MGYPFLVGEIDRFLKAGIEKIAPTAIERLECAKEHLQALYLYKGERGVRQARKHMTWYAKGFPNAGELRDKLARMETVTEGCDLIDRAIDCLNAGGEFVNEPLTLANIG